MEGESVDIKVRWQHREPLLDALRWFAPLVRAVQESRTRDNAARAREELGMTIMNTSRSMCKTLLKRFDKVLQGPLPDSEAARGERILELPTAAMLCIVDHTADPESSDADVEVFRFVHNQVNTLTQAPSSMGSDAAWRLVAQRVAKLACEGRVHYCTGAIGRLPCARPLEHAVHRGDMAGAAGGSLTAAAAERQPEAR